MKLRAKKLRRKLKTYQEKLAEAIWDGINEILCLKKQKENQIVDSANNG